MPKPTPFRDSDERDELLSDVRQLDGAARLLPALIRNPDLVRYRLTGAVGATPMLPSPADVARAMEVLQQAAECLRNHYRQRVRYDDHPDPWGAKGDLDDEVPL